MDPRGDPPQPRRPVIDAVHRRHDREQHLRGADVARRPLAADVLLTRLKGHAIGLAPVHVVADADDAAGEGPLEGVARGDEARVRPPVAHRHAEALGAADGDVRPELAGRPQEREGEEVCGHDDQSPAGVGALAEAPVVADRPARVGVLDQDPGDVTGLEVDGLGIDDPDLHTDGLGPALDHGAGLGEDLRVDDEDPLLAAAELDAHAHRLGGRGRLVEQRSARQGQPGEVGDHRLEDQQRLQPPLRDLSLIGGVLGVPAGVLEHVSLDHRRRHAAVVAEADQRAQEAISTHDPAQRGQGLPLARLALRREIVGQREGLGGPDRSRDGRVDQRLQGVEIERPEHLGDLMIARAEVAAHKGVSRGERGEKLGRIGHQRPFARAPIR